MNGLEERVANIEGTVSQMNERMNHLGDEIKGLRGEMKSMETSLRGEMKSMETSLRTEISSSRNWTIGLIITMWVTIILAVFFT